MQLKYRPDIDGLRAVAVLSVVAFHAFPEYLTGGFVGVDVFFVISGFLITGILLGNLQTTAHPIVQFYVRRSTRIFPALIAMLLFSLILGWYTLHPDEYRQLGKHVAGGAFFAANLVNWFEAGYFDNAAILKPLLHLWSLGIEEQFYIAWPLLLFLVTRPGRHRLTPLGLTVGLGLASLLLGIYTVLADTTAAFYSPFTRAWELLMGAFAAQLKLYSRASEEAGDSLFSSKLAVNLGSIVGVMLILVASASFEKDDRFPGYLALVPTLGAFLIIASGREAWANRLLLSSKPMVWIGLISYPFYLWHWPLLSFLTIFTVGGSALMVSGGFSVGARIVAVLLSVLLAWLTYRYIESPIRHRKKKESAALVLAVLLAVTGLAGFVVKAADGVSDREFVQNNNYHFDTIVDLAAANRVNQVLCGESFKKLKLANDITCLRDTRGGIRYALIGDSKAQALYSGVVANSREGGRWLKIGTLPLITDSNLYKPGFGYHRNATPVVFHWLEEQKDIEVVVIAIAARRLFGLGKTSAMSLESLPESKNYQIAYDALEKTVAAIESMHKKVVLVIDNPTVLEPRHCVSRKSPVPFFNDLFSGNDRKGCVISLERHLYLQGQYLALVQNLRKTHPGLHVFDGTHLLCDMDKNVCPSVLNDKLMYSYQDHISRYSANLLAKELVPLVESLSQR